MLSISEKLKQARLNANMTQEAVAEHVGVSRQTISNWENGKSYPDISSVISLSDLYGLTLDALLKGDKDMINHLKESTDVVKSNKQLAASFVLAGVLFAVFFLVRIFVPIPRIAGVIPGIIAVAIFVTGMIVVLAATINIKKFAEQKIAYKTLMKIGIVLLYILIYIPLLLVIPEAISSGLQLETGWLNALIRSATAIILAIPAFGVYKMWQRLFSEK